MFIICLILSLENCREGLTNCSTILQSVNDSASSSMELEQNTQFVWSDLTAAEPQLERIGLTVDGLKALLPEIERRVVETREMVISIA